MLTYNIYISCTYIKVDSQVNQSQSIKTGILIIIIVLEALNGTFLKVNYPQFDSERDSKFIFILNTTTLKLYTE